MSQLRLHFAAVVLCACSAARAADPAAPAPLSGTKESKNVVILLDGAWQIAEGKMDKTPGAFDRTVPVPGLVSLATPAFQAPGPKVANRQSIPQKDPRRDAFWYRRTFTLAGPIPAVATLKVAKAMFGTRVFLNGTLLGDHAPSFTPGYFDARPAIQTGTNEILIRVGADRDAVGRAHVDGFDFEKERYIPGIFDSVKLILSGTPHFVSVQAAPDVAGKAVRVEAVLRNAGPAARAAVKFVVCEAKSGKVVGHAASQPASLANGAETTVDVRIPIEDCRLWSPEDPFLYTLEADSGADTYRTRFGMRQFKFDPATGRAVLNGKPYFMRGSNITLYRFFEDSECGSLPWNGKWVRLLHQRVKDMHWNCLRYCIGFPPEAWYDAADEAGILIDDEFPIWFGGDVPKPLKTEELAKEYSEWLRDRWNHPCVAIWDACNETLSPKTGAAFKQVRAMDLSNRPWDNGYSRPQEPGDMLEAHPYHFFGSFRLRNLATANPQPGDGKHAVVINEYGWHWVNRDGTPTTLTRDLYRNVLGEKATAAQRFHVQATWLAADTEFWRSHRKAAAVMHFTTLGYSRPDGQTCDHWKQGGVARLEWEPEFYRYVRDAFAPVGDHDRRLGRRVPGRPAARVPPRGDRRHVRPVARHGPAAADRGREDPPGTQPAVPRGRPGEADAAVGDRHSRPQRAVPPGGGPGAAGRRGGLQRARLLGADAQGATGATASRWARRPARCRASPGTAPRRPPRPSTARAIPAGRRSSPTRNGSPSTWGKASASRGSSWPGRRPAPRPIPSKSLPTERPGGRSIAPRRERAASNRSASRPPTPAGSA